MRLLLKPSWLDSGKTVSLEDRPCSRTECFRDISSWLFSPSLSWKNNLLFSLIDNLVGFLVMKFTKVGGGLPSDWNPWSFNLNLFMLSLQQFFNHNLGFPMLVIVVVVFSASELCWIDDSLYLPISLTNFGGSGLLCDPSSLII